MWETRPVEIVVDLPKEMARNVEEMNQTDPDYLRRVIRYGLARRAVYRSLEREGRVSAPSAPDSIPDQGED